MDREPLDAATPGFLGSDVGDAPTPGPDHGGGEEEDEGEDGNEGEGEGDIDEELAAELDLALGDEEAEGDDEEEDEEEDESEEEDDDDDDEMVQVKKLLNEEIRDLEAAVAKKGNEITSSANPLIRVRGILHRTLKADVDYVVQRRFEDALKKLQADLDMKLAQRDEMKEKQRMRKEGLVAEDADTEGGIDGDGEDGAEAEDDLFGDDPSAGMDVD